jgi:hypothetical protein
MKPNRLTVAAIIAVLPLAALAQDNAAPKVYLPQFAQHTSICGEGAALTFTLQCDLGSRSPVDRIWLPAGAGVEICQVRETRCEPIPGFRGARPGFEVQDTPAAGSMAVVSFGVGRLLGVEP